jgi:hypothetical protein
LLTVASAFFIGSRVEQSYEAKATLLLLSPPVTQNSEGDDVAANPFLLSGTAERVAAASVLAVTGNTQWKAAMEAEGAEGDFEYASLVAPREGELLPVSAPIIEVRSAAETPEEALLTLDVATRLFQEQFEENQRRAGAPSDLLISSEVLSSTVEPVLLSGSRARAMLAVGVLGLAATATILVLLESVAPGWKPRLRVAPLRRAWQTILVLLESVAPGWKPRLRVAPLRRAWQSIVAGFGQASRLPARRHGADSADSSRAATTQEPSQTIRLERRRHEEEPPGGNPATGDGTAG